MDEMLKQIYRHPGYIAFVESRATMRDKELRKELDSIEAAKKRALGNYEAKLKALDENHAMIRDRIFQDFERSQAAKIDFLISLLERGKPLPEWMW